MQILLLLGVMFALTSAFSRSARTAIRNSNVSKVLRMSGGATPVAEELMPFYALGVNVARQVGGELKGILKKEELDAMIAGFSASMKGVEKEEETVLRSYGNKLNELLTERQGQIVENEKKKGKDYVVKYLLSQPRAKQTPSGLLFNEIIAGVGAQPTAADEVVVHYEGTLTDGTVFDSSKKRGEPIKFPLRNVIRGWTEGVQMMREGGKATLICPSDLAYGDNGSPPTIPAGATLIFEVELLEVVKK